MLLLVMLNTRFCSPICKTRLEDGRRGRCKGGEDGFVAPLHTLYAREKLN